MDGQVWLDANANGLIDTGEAGVANVTVNLLNGSGTTVATTTTDNNGNYGFVNLNPSSSYAIQVIAPAGDVFTFYEVGSNPAIWSATSTSGQTNYFQVSAGSTLVENSGLVASGTVNAISGPGAVPGNSLYTYTVTVSGQVDPSWSLRIASPVNPPSDTVNTALILGPNYDSTSNLTTESIELAFGNSSPADIFLNASVGGQQVASKEIYLVQVTVAPPDAPAVAFQHGNPQDGGLGQLSNGTEIKLVSSGPNVAPWGLSWNAKVTLTGPGNNLGVNMIHVGFIQHINVQTMEGQYAIRNQGDQPYLISSLQGTTYLDMMQDLPANNPPTYQNAPWYDRQAQATFFNATATNNVATINSGDQPTLGPPVTFEQLTPGQITAPGATYRPLTAVSLLVNFTTDVAAQTTDTSNGANNSYWGEARGAWSFNGNGNVGAPPNWTWSSNGAAVTPPAGGAWANLPAQTQENTNPPIFNNLLGTVTYRASATP